MKLINWKTLAMWALPNDEGKRPSNFATKEIIENKLNEYNPPWETYF